MVNVVAPMSLGSLTSFGHGRICLSQDSAFRIGIRLSHVLRSPFMLYELRSTFPVSLNKDSSRAHDILNTSLKFCRGLYGSFQKSGAPDMDPK